MTTAIILLAHGSRNPEVVGQFDQLRALVQDQTGCELVRIAFQEFNPPDLAKAAAECIKAGATRLLVMPYFLFSGGHVTRDIPQECAKLAKRYPGVELQLTAPLGVHAKLAEVVADRIRQRCDEVNWAIHASQQEKL